MEIPFLVDKETRELAEVGRDWLSGEDTFWVQFFLIILVFSIPAAIGYYTGWLWFGIAPHWFGGAGLFLAVCWAGMNKWWDGQKRTSARFTSLGFDGTVADLTGWPIPAAYREGKQLHPELVAFNQGVRAWMTWRSARSTKIINRADGILYINEDHILSNTLDKEVLWEELPEDVQAYIRRYRRRKQLNVKFTDRNPELGRPVIGTKFAYGDMPRWAVFADREYPMDIDLVSQKEAAEHGRSTAEIGMGYGLGVARTTSKISATATVKEAKRRPVASQPEPAEDEEDSFE